ncbi:MAG: hypothetical protein P4L53_03035 [Candidatus Obscuribacterales bacterium]|nr:hypothetical protein [Candidatus Obscuribacterales bacterium]
MTQTNSTRTLTIGLLLAALMGVSQRASFAGFMNLLDDENETASPNAQGQTIDKDDSKSIIKDNNSNKLGISGIRSAVSELMQDEFPQRSFDKRLANARKNIEKGEKMMQSCGEDHTKAEYKKGKVMKEIGEKNLAELKADSRFPSDYSTEPAAAAKTKEVPDSL